MSNKALSKKLASWVVVVLGFLLGVFGLVRSGTTWIDPDPSPWAWLRNRSEAAGPALLGFLLVVASLAAVRSRQRAGLLLLLGAPVAALVLTYPSAGLWGNEPNGSTYYILPEPLVAALLSLLFYLPFAAGFFASRKPKRAAVLSLAFAALAAVAFALWDWTAALLPSLVCWSAFFWAFGVFWLGSHKLNWPVLRTGPRSPVRRLGTGLALAGVVAILAVAGTLALTAMRSALRGGECSGSAPSIQPRGPDHAVFTARIIRTRHTARVSGRWAGEWGIGLVEESFWGPVPWRGVPVLLTNSVFWEGETYLISGIRAGGVLTRYLPVMEGVNCGDYLSVPAAKAKIQLRFLRNPAAATGLRIAGYALGPAPPAPKETAKPSRAEDFYALLHPRRDYAPLAGARIALAGSSGTTVLVTDRDGIYETQALPADDYTLTLVDVPPNQNTWSHRVEERVLVKVGVVQCDLYTDWQGEPPHSPWRPKTPPPASR
jgi:hypothetical protein